jgi:RHH-type transcriptional regulator, rel operon repressor / antitoxin RelB
MAISLRLNSTIDRELAKIARAEGTSKSDLVRLLISEFVSKKSKRPTPWELGENLFGRYGSRKGNLSKDRKSILREKLRAKKSRH